MSGFTRGTVVAALAAEVRALGVVLDGLGEREAAVPTRCSPWDVTALAMHTVGAVARVWDALDGPSGADGGLVSAVGYYAPDVRFSAEVDAERVDSALEAARGRSGAGGVDRVLAGSWEGLAPRLLREPEGRVVVTRHGDRMLLTDFLVTRVFEVAVHGLDLADALGREPWLSGPASSVLVRLLFSGADPEVLEHVVPGLRVVGREGLQGSGNGAALAAVRAVTGRGLGPGERALAEGLRDAGVCFLALGR